MQLNEIIKFQPENIVITPMELEHLNQVYEVETDSFSIPWTKESLRKEIEENNLALYFVALVGGKVTGYAGMWHVVTEGHITNIAVKAEYRNKGIGSMLMERIIETACQKEMIGITLEMRLGNMQAMKLYNKFGFVVEGLRKNYYSDTKEDAVIMWKYL